MNTTNTVSATKSVARLSPREQFDLIRGEWHLHDFRLSNKVYDDAEAAISRLPNIIPSGAVVQLVPYLPGADGLDPIQRTCEHLWGHVRFAYPEYHCDPFVEFKRISATVGCKHKVGLRWEIIDFKANRQGKPSEVCKRGPCPGPGILAVAAVQPEVFREIGEMVLLPGYKVKTVFDGESILSVSYVRGDPGINLSCLSMDLDPEKVAKEHPDFNWVIPSFVRV